MAKIEYNIFQIESDGLSGFRTLSNEDTLLLTSAEVSKTFKPNNNFIELSYYTLDNIRLQTIPNYTNYSILSGDTKNGESGNSEIGIDVEQDLLSYGLQGQEVKALYNFLDYPYSNTINPQDFYIESISPDRTELRLVSVNLGGSEVLDTTNQLIEQFNNQAFSPDLHLYFGNNIFYSIVNMDVEEFRETNAVLVKLYNPLPSVVNVKARLNIVEKVSDSIAFEINTKITPDKLVIPTLRGANFDIEIETQNTEPSQYFNYNELFSFPTTNTYRELNTLFNEKGAEIGVDYSDFSNFINFSSAEERLRNFKYKLQLLDSYQTQLDLFNDPGFNYSGQGLQGSSQYYTNLIDGIINNFDHYERHLFYESGSTSWPKQNATKPYTNQEHDNPAALSWYNAELQDAVLYDAQNPDILTNTIPAYLKEDTDNRPYELFIHMIAQHFDNVWLYTNAVSKKYDNDNRLNRGVSKDLVEDLLKNFGVKLYTSNRSAQDLFKYFTANSYDTVDAEPNLDPIITGSANPISQNDYQKEIYKRIYHNLPLLMKSKGTERGLRALINCFGIPSDTLKIRLYGGQSSEDLPFFGGEQPFTGSIDKVRLNNTGSIVDGDTLSQFTSINKPVNYYTQDLHSIEVGFSPTHNINEYILSQSAVLFPNDPIDIDQYIGDPREIDSNQYYYLREYSNQIFEGTDAYDLKDFVRLIKFFDNVIFRMVRDFIPARAVADTGIIIKPHLLERSKYTSPTLSWTQPEYSGSINTAFITGSHGGAFKSIGNGAVSSSKFNGESSTAYRELVKTPSGSLYKKWNKLSSFTSQVIDSTIYPPVYDREQDQAKFDGELSGSRILVSDGELNRDNPFKNLNYSTVLYNVSFYRNLPQEICIIQSRGNSTTPFIFRPDEGPWDLSTFFEYCNNGDYDYLVNYGTVDPSTEGQYSFPNITLTQYTPIRINAYKTNGSPFPDSECQAETIAVPVTCDMSVNTSTLPFESNVSVNNQYNLTEWFNPNLNTNSSILVNGTVVSNPQEHQFTQEQGTQVVITLRDNIDNSCSTSVILTVNNCALIPKPDINQLTPVLMNWENTGTVTTTEYLVSSFFNFADADTEYKLQIEYSNIDGQTIYTDPITLIGADYPDVVGTYYNGANGNGDYTVPVNQTDLFDRYNNSLPADLITYLQVRAFVIVATQPLVDGCVVSSLRVKANKVISATLPRLPILFGYDQTGGETTCAITVPNVVVYIDGAHGQLNSTQVVENNIFVYKTDDLSDLTPADTGYYIDLPELNSSPTGYAWRWAENTFGTGDYVWYQTYNCDDNTGFTPPGG